MNRQLWDRFIYALAVMLVCICATGICVSSGVTVAWASCGESAKKDGTPTIWQQLRDEYRYDDEVNQLMLVRYLGGSKARIKFYVKTEEHKWDKVFSEVGYVGENGIDKKKEGDKRTPTGVYNLCQPFGIKKNPGSAQKYRKVNKNHYWCSDKKYYNKFVNIKKKPHRCRGEHLYYYGRAYYYAMFVDYNVEGEYGKGSAIFLHVKGSKKSTSGCIAISEANMKKVIKKADYGTKICIY